VTLVSYRVISSGYFNVWTIPMIRGRTFTDRDTGATPAVAMINQAMAQRFWQHSDPLTDQLIAFPGTSPIDEPARQIVGIVGDVRDGLVLNPGPHPTIYVPLSQHLDRESTALTTDTSWVWIVRTRLPPQAVASAVADELRYVTHGSPVSGIRAMDDLVVQSSAPTRFNMLVVGLFASSALLLSAIGVYGVTAYAVQQRTREIGIRIALGAAPDHVRNRVAIQGMGATMIGVLIGAAAGLGLTRLLASFLFGVTARDPITFLAAPLVLTAVALVAIWIPASRAARVDPMIALRAE
jgi:putative ABC transport system permease protein